MEFNRVWQYREYVRRVLADKGRPAEDLQILARRLGRLLGQRLDCRFRWNPSPVLGREHLIMTGSYDYHESGGTMNIWINSHPACRIYHWDQGGNISWLRFVQDLSECVMHEKVHYLQHRSRDGYEPWFIEHYEDADMNYYADPDEIDAYAWSWVSECMDRQGLASMFDPDEEMVWWNYDEYFGVNHPVRRRLIKKAYVRLVQAQERGH